MFLSFLLTGIVGAMCMYVYWDVKERERDRVSKWVCVCVCVRESVFISVEPCGVLQYCVAVCCSGVLQCSAVVCGSVLQWCVAVCCSSVLQCVAVVH